MVVVVTSNDIDVHGDAGALRETLQTVGQHFGAKITNLLATQLQVADAEGTVGQVDDCAGEGFVKRSVCVAEASETGGRLEGGLEGLAVGKYMYSFVLVVMSTDLAHSNEDVLGSVVVVNVEVTTASELQTPARVLCKGVNHVVQEANASVNVDGL